MKRRGFSILEKFYSMNCARLFDFHNEGVSELDLHKRYKVPIEKLIERLHELKKQVEKEELHWLIGKYHLLNRLLRGKILLVCYIKRCWQKNLNYTKKGVIMVKR